MVAQSSVYRFADVEVREREYTLVKADEVASVEPKAFRVLLLLLRNPQKLISKDELLQAVWGDAVVTENSLTRSIALLRRLLGDDTRDPRYIETVATVGYRFLCKVDVSEAPGGELDKSGEPTEWSQDGQYVYVLESGGGFARIVRVRIRDRVQEDVLSLKDFPALVDPFTAWYGLTPDGKILLMRDRSVQEIYALTLEKK